MNTYSLVQSSSQMPKMGALDGYVIILYSHSVDPQKLCVGLKYYTVHMYSMPYYTYGSTANFLVLEPTALLCIYISKEWCCNEDLRGVRNFRYLQRFF